MAVSKPQIVFAEAYADQVMDRARLVGDVTVLDACDEASLTRGVRACDALLIRSASNVTAEVLAAAPRLKVIGRGGAGLDNIDLMDAQARGVCVVYTPAAATDAVADLAIGMMINLVRGISPGDSGVRSGQFSQARRNCVGRELSSLTLGIVGMGRIGQAVGRRASLGFNMPVLFNDLVDPGPLCFEATPVEKERLFRESDLVSVHVPLTDSTRGMIGRDELSTFKRGSIVINTSRGAVVDAAALAAALSSGALGGAGLDVFDPEPLPMNHPLMKAPNTLFTPHLGARTTAALDRMDAVVDDVLAVLRGEKPRFPVGRVIDPAKG